MIQLSDLREPPAEVDVVLEFLVEPEVHSTQPLALALRKECSVHALLSWPGRTFDQRITFDPQSCADQLAVVADQVAATAEVSAFGQRPVEEALGTVTHRERRPAIERGLEDTDCSCALGKAHVCERVIRPSVLETERMEDR